MTADLTAALDAALAFHEQLRVWCVRLDPFLSAASPRLAAPWGHFVRGVREHLDVEEHELFPAIRALIAGHDPTSDDFLAPLRDMEHEADELETIATALRNAAAEAPDVEVELLDMLDRLDRHAHLEAEVVFPASIALYEAWRDRNQRPTPNPARATTPDPAPSAPAGGRLFRLLRRFTGS